MRKSHFNDEFLVLLGPIISRLFTCSNVEKNKIKKKQRVLALVLSLWVEHLTHNPEIVVQTLPPALGEWRERSLDFVKSNFENVSFRKQNSRF